MSMKLELREYRLRLLRKLIAQHGLGVGGFAKLVGLNSSSQLSQYLGDHRAIGDGFARRVEKHLGLRQGYFDLPDTGEAATMLDAHEAGSIGNVTAQPGSDGTLVPLLQTVPAGPWKEYVSAENNKNVVISWLPCPITPFGSNTFALKVQGESMVADGSRSYPPGAIIFVDPDAMDECQPDHAVLALLGNGQVVFKILVEDAGRRYLKSLARGYPLIEEPFDIIGKVIGTFTPENT